MPSLLHTEVLEVIDNLYDRDAALVTLLLEIERLIALKQELSQTNQRLAEMLERALRADEPVEAETFVAP